MIMYKSEFQCTNGNSAQQTFSAEGKDLMPMNLTFLKLMDTFLLVKKSEGLRDE